MSDTAGHGRSILWAAAVTLLATALLAWAGYVFWSPGMERHDGRHDRGANAVWLGHGWLGADDWFERYGKQDEINTYRDPESAPALAERLRRYHISDVFPHVAPAGTDGALPAVDHEQVERFLDAMGGIRVLPWIGGVTGKQVRLQDGDWRATFVRSVTELLLRHPRFAGVHINIEPLQTGNAHFLALLDELEQALPADKLLSVAAFPPPSLLRPFVTLDWDEAYYRELARRVDQIAVMMYDTGLPSEKLYRALMTDWTRKLVAWTAGSRVLLGVPTYDDAGAPYHQPRVENLRNALAGIHVGLSGYAALPEPYQGVAIYADWETDADEWGYWADHFQSP